MYWHNLVVPVCSALWGISIGGIHAYLTLTHPYMVMVGALMGICVQVQVVVALHSGGARYTNQM